jgi:hypothetical protein
MSEGSRFDPAKCGSALLDEPTNQAMTPTPANGNPTRREFLRGAARHALLAAFAAFAVSSVARSSNAKSCLRRVPCQACQLFARCDLPAALKVKRER